MPAFLDTLGSIPLTIAAVVLLFAAAWGTGGWFVPTFAVTARRQWENDLLRMVVGLNLVAWMGITLGMSGALANGRSAWLLIIMALFACDASARLRIASSLGRWRQCRWPKWDEILLGLIAFVTLGPALCYPTGWDEMVYHGVLPRRWLIDGHPAVYRDLPYSGFPSFGEILFWLIAPIEALIAPRLVIWGGWMIGLLLLNGVLRRAGAGTLSTLITCGFALSPAVLMISANCYVESLLMMNVAAMLLAATRFRRQRAKVILGVLAGGAAAIKLTGLVVLALPVIWFWALKRSRPADRNHGLRSCGMALSIAILICLPFYLRPWWATGNPLYPFLAEWWTTTPVTVAMSRYHHTIGDLGFGVRSIETLIVAPLLLGLHDQLYDGGFGWQWLLFLTFAAWGVWKTLRSGRNHPIRFPLLAGLLLYFAWFLTAQQGRFAVPMAVAVIGMAAAGVRQIAPVSRGQRLFQTVKEACGWPGLERTREGPETTSAVRSGPSLRSRPGHPSLKKALAAPVSRRLFAGALLVAMTISLPWRTASYYAACWETVGGRWSWAETLDDATQGKYVALLAALEEHTPPDARLVLLFEHRGLYLPRANVVGTPYFQEAWFMPPEQFHEAGPLVNQLTVEGGTHLVMATSPVGPDWSPDYWERSQPLLQGIAAALQTRQLRVVWQSEHHVLLEVIPPLAQ